MWKEIFLTYLYNLLYISLSSLTNMSKIVSYSEVRNNLKTYLDYVTESHDPVFITRKNGEEVVMIAKSDYEAMDETAYLLSTEANKKNLLETVNKINEGDIAKP